LQSFPPPHPAWGQKRQRTDDAVEGANLFGCRLSIYYDTKIIVMVGSVRISGRAEA